jgi:uncharacterized protein
MRWLPHTLLLLAIVGLHPAAAAAVATVSDPANDDPYRQWLAFKDNFAQVAGGPAGMYSIQDMIVLAPGETAYLPPAKRRADAHWSKDGKRAPGAFSVEYADNHATLRGPGLQPRDLLQQADQQFTLPSGQIVRISNYEGDLRKLWLHDPTLPARRKFQSLAYFPYDPTGVVKGTFIRKPNPVGVNHLDSRNHSGLMYWVGDVELTIGGKKQRLRAFNYQQDWAQTGHLLLFLRDRTSGKTSYGGGRVLEVHFPPGAPRKQLTLNLNMLYAFLCAHSDFFNCPLNLTDKVDVALTYGEKYPPVLGGRAH